MPAETPGRVVVIPPAVYFKLSILAFSVRFRNFSYLLFAITNCGSFFSTFLQKNKKIRSLYFFSLRVLLGCARSIEVRVFRGKQRAVEELK